MIKVKFILSYILSILFYHSFNTMKFVGAISNKLTSGFSGISVYKTLESSC